MKKDKTRKVIAAPAFAIGIGQRCLSCLMAFAQSQGLRFFSAGLLHHDATCLLHHDAGNTQTHVSSYDKIKNLAQMSFYVITLNSKSAPKDTMPAEDETPLSDTMCHCAIRLSFADMLLM